MIYILGIAGTFMAGLASLAKQSGIEVGGCDAQVYPPMSTLLADQGIEIDQGYEIKNLPSSDHQVVIGNALSRGNELVEAVLNQQLDYISGPQWLAENILSRRSTYAVAGTHGKTSTSAMLAWILETAGLNPGFLVGGKPGNFEVSARLGSGKPFVIEADEYDTAFFDKRSKFVHYRPQVAILNNLEYDHADIFADLDAIKTQFHHFIRTIPGDGKLIVNADDVNLDETLAMGVWTPVEGFSLHDQTADWFAQTPAADASSFTVFHHQKVYCEIAWDCFGQHNMGNALAAIAAAHQAGVSPQQTREALASFKLPAKRLQLHSTQKGFILFEDFAHHPTAIATTLSTLKARYPHKRLIAVLEPRSNTMRSDVHTETLPAALRQADAVYYLKPAGLPWSLDEAALAGRCIHAFEEVAQGAAALHATLNDQDVVVVMSNGSFDGMVDLLRETECAH